MRWKELRGTIALTTLLDDLAVVCSIPQLARSTEMHCMAVRCAGPVERRNRNAQVVLPTCSQGTLLPEKSKWNTDMHMKYMENDRNLAPCTMKRFVECVIDCDRASTIIRPVEMPGTS